MARWTCTCCGEDDNDTFLHEHCWECGAPRLRITPAARRQVVSAEDVDAQALAAAKTIFAVAVGKLASCDKFKMHALIVDTCKAKGAVFAKHFMSLVLSDERFAAVVAIMSPATKEARF